ncbi:HNH endonuclease signature motif containing protein [Micromonospora peucetia]|uniref:HNH endonuclease n=1 Tax=Micromonospora peucetia TaxID=47871 RepID=A0ABZ1EJS7_9ACTN|nr:HNH endonuclease signature motif containing protein [Micromonospora peucetia]WSA34514.1 HNH endonuclease [Micromonospora peucetia]
MNTTNRTLDWFFRGIASAPSFTACWIWGGRPTRDGYGTFGKATRAHRRAYELAVGPIPKGLVIDHLCETRLCVNPLHLRATTQRHNVLRSVRTMPNVNAGKTHCPSGHPYDEANTYHRPAGGRDCRACSRRKRAA